MIGEEELERLGEARLRQGNRSFAEIQERAARLRRGRRAVRGVVGGLVVAGAAAAVFVAVSPGTLGSHAARFEPATRSAQPDPKAGCAPVVSRQRTYADVPGLLYLPPVSVAGQIKGPVRVRADIVECEPQDPVVIHYALRDGVVSARIAVEGPAAVDQYAGGHFPGRTGVADVGGVQAQVYWDQTSPGPKSTMLYLFWKARDGSTWSVRYDGASVADGLEAVRAVTAAGGHLDQTAAPPGLDGVVTAPSPMPAHEFDSVSTMLRGAHGSGSLSLVADPRNWEVDAWYGSRLVHVDGREAWWQADLSELTWTTPTGVGLLLQGDQGGGNGFTAERAVEVAAATSLVRSDDPRLVAAAEPPASTPATGGSS